MRPKSEIYTPKQDDEHPHPLHMLSPPRGLPFIALRPGGVQQSFLLGGSAPSSNSSSTWTLFRTFSRIFQSHDYAFVSPFVCFFWQAELTDFPTLAFHILRLVKRLHPFTYLKPKRGRLRAEPPVQAIKGTLSPGPHVEYSRYRFRQF